MFSGGELKVVNFVISHSKLRTQPLTFKKFQNFKNSLKGALPLCPPLPTPMSFRPSTNINTTSLLLCPTFRYFRYYIYFHSGYSICISVFETTEFSDS